MIIAGGLYRETCEVPKWNALYGSGGRAAVAVASLSPGSELCTYAAPGVEHAAKEFESRGLRLSCARSRTAIVFCYFHPLSHPHIAPPVSTIPQESSLRAMGSAVVRFGFLEGDAIVEADRAVYDPQTHINPARFSANGSKANELIIVLNEGELRTMGSSSDIFEASRNLIASEGAEFIVAKGGVRGATIFYANGEVGRVPAYKSNRVFKIGTGDVFTGVLAYYWAEVRKSPIEAADLASRAVAAYAQTKQLPISPNSGADLAPANVEQSGAVLLLGTARNIEDRWLMEEAAWCLRELGLNVVCPSLDGPAKQIMETATAALVLANGELDPLQTDLADIAKDLPTVVFSQKNSAYSDVPMPISVVTPDFATAIYASCWVAMGA